ncbi:MAG: argininosuccinate lyase, partial [Gammaproteobacteria bacterium]|nr:argininosuccinate lyase [Gammaproteobacteria bacterium]
QEDKEPLFDCLDTVEQCIAVYAAMIPSIEVRRERTRASALQGFTTATDLADYLVRKGVPFRDAHEVVGRAVKHALEHDCDLAELPLEVLKGFSVHIDADVFEVLTLEGSLQARAHFGGTAPARVREAVVRARERLAAPHA